MKLERTKSHLLSDYEWEKINKMIGGSLSLSPLSPVSDGDGDDGDEISPQDSVTDIKSELEQKADDLGVVEVEKLTDGGNSIAYKLSKDYLLSLPFFKDERETIQSILNEYFVLLIYKFPFDQLSVRGQIYEPQIIEMKKGLIEQTLKDPNIKVAKYVSYMLRIESQNLVINLCEYVGPDLFDFINGQSPLIQKVDFCIEPLNGQSPLFQKVGFCIKSFEALISLHKAGILHCDIKPENICYNLNGEVFFIDMSWTNYEQILALARSGNIFLHTMMRVDLKTTKEYSHSILIKLKKISELRFNDDYYTPEIASKMVFDILKVVDMHSIGLCFFVAILLDLPSREFREEREIGYLTENNFSLVTKRIPPLLSSIMIQEFSDLLFNIIFILIYGFCEREETYIEKTVEGCLKELDNIKKLVEDKKLVVNDNLQAIINYVLKFYNDEGIKRSIDKLNHLVSPPSKKRVFSAGPQPPTKKSYQGSGNKKKRNNRKLKKSKGKKGRRKKRSLNKTKKKSKKKKTRKNNKKNSNENFF